MTTGSRREFHQAKRSHPSGKWGLAELGAADVRLLQTFGEALAGNNHRFVFASGSDARKLSDLCEAANHAESVEEFERAFLAAGVRSKSFSKLLGYWACDVPTAVERLRADRSPNDWRACSRTTGAMGGAGALSYGSEGSAGGTPEDC